jgi:cytochrome c
VITRLAAALLVAASPALAEDGEAIFAARCASCHAAVSGTPPGAGPNLAGVVGRPVAGDAAYDYSPALREARAAGTVWTEAALVRFLKDPEAMFPGLWMGGNGLSRDDDAAAVTRFLARMTTQR